jgi:NADH:ubiquinone oxidoreductase subunit 4 (subunit M)
MDALIQLRGIEKKYRVGDQDIYALRHIDLDIPKGEFLALMGAYQVSTWATLIATTGIILGAAYMLYLYRRVVFGDLVKDDVKAMPDLSRREMALLVVPMRMATASCVSPAWVRALSSWLTI